MGFDGPVWYQVDVADGAPDAKLAVGQEGQEVLGVGVMAQGAGGRGWGGCSEPCGGVWHCYPGS